MNKYSVLETSKMLKISKDTLRYYDRMKLVSPERGQNKYRYYKDSDVFDLRYIEVMKYAGFSLKEIGKILENKRGCSGENLADTLGLLDNKQKEIYKKIEIYQYMTHLISEAMEMLKGKGLQGESEEMNVLILNIFEEMKGEVNEK